MKSIAEHITDQALALDVNAIPAAVRTRIEALLIDVVGLCVAARNADYIKALRAGVDSGGPATAIGQYHTVRLTGATGSTFTGAVVLPFAALRAGSQLAVL